jgi:endonuclease/exonuclease/phosphatase family metal-dependent hydrolase
VELTVMSYNIKVGSWTTGGLEAVAQVIADAEPDIVALQEVDRGIERTGHIDQAGWLGRRLGYHAVFGPATGGKAFGVDAGEYGIAMLSRRPIVEHERRLLYHQPLPPEQRPPRYYTEQRAMLGCAIDVDGILIDAVCTHFDLTEDQRIHQAAQVAEFTTGWHAGRPAILMGDFNAEPDSDEIAIIRRVLRDVFQEQQIAGEQRITFPSGPLGSRTEDGWAGAIDYVFVTPEFRVREITVLREISPASDHAPVIARLVIDG